MMYKIEAKEPFLPLITPSHYQMQQAWRTMASIRSTFACLVKRKGGVNQRSSASSVTRMLHQPHHQKHSTVMGVSRRRRICNDRGASSAVVAALHRGALLSSAHSCHRYGRRTASCLIQDPVLFSRGTRRYHQPPAPKKEESSSEKDLPIEKKQQAEGSSSSSSSSSSNSQDVPGSSLRETYWTTPNIITMSRIACSPILSWLILEGRYEHAVAGVVVAALSDWLDGYIAKNYNQTSILGGFLDPLADKVLVACLSIPLTVQGYIPGALLFVVVGRDALLIMGSIIQRAANKPKDSPFFDTTHSATFQIVPSPLSKFNTALQFTVMALALSRAICEMPPDVYFEPLCWLTGITTVTSGLSYLAGDGTTLLKMRKQRKHGSSSSSKGKGK